MITLASVALVSGASAQIASPVLLSFSDIGADAVQIGAAGGQTFADIGALTGLSNESGAAINSAENPLWYTAASTNFTVSHDRAANASGFIINLGTPAPEPSSALLVALSALGFIGRRKR